MERKKVRSSRAKPVRKVSQAELKKLREMEMDRRHREGYLRFPVQPDEFSVDEDDLAWGEPW